MTEESRTEVLGVGEYRANWIARSLSIRVRARGLLPCENYDAFLSIDETDASGMTFDMTFLVDDYCIRQTKPFFVESGTVWRGDEMSSAAVVIRDSVGTHKIEVEEDDYAAPDQFRVSTSSLAEELDIYLVYAKLPQYSGSHHGCIVVPADSFVTAIRYRAFGPASREECERFVAESCSIEVPPKPILAAGEIPWPLKPVRVSR